MAQKPEQYSNAPYPIFPIGLENLIKLQKSTLEVYARQTSSAINAFRMFCPMLPPTIFDAAQQGVAEIFRVQCQVLDSMTDKTKNYLEQSRGNPVIPDPAGITGLLRNSSDYFLAIHKSLVEVFANQLQNFANVARIQTADLTGGQSSNTRDALQSGVASIMEFQKNFWNLWLRPLR